MRGKNSRLAFAKGQCQAMKQLVRAVPDVLVRPDAQLRLEHSREFLPDSTVDSVGADKQIAVVLQRRQIADLVMKMDLNAKCFAAALQNFQQTKPRDSREAVAVDRDLLIAMDHIDIVPGLELAHDFAV